jgi:hypothetical protein
MSSLCTAASSGTESYARTTAGAASTASGRRRTRACARLRGDSPRAGQGGASSRPPRSAAPSCPSQTRTGCGDAGRRGLQATAATTTHTCECGRKRRRCPWPWRRVRRRRAAARGGNLTVVLKAHTVYSLLRRRELVVLFIKVVRGVLLLARGLNYLRHPRRRQLFKHAHTHCRHATSALSYHHGDAARRAGLRVQHLEARGGRRVVRDVVAKALHARTTDNGW